MRSATNKSNNKGFSLVEVLMFLAIVGILLGIALPHVASANDYKAARDRRNAQELSSFAAATQAAGLDLIVDESIKLTVTNLMRGGIPSSGAFKGHLFVGPKLLAEDAEAASKYLKIENGSVIYRYDPPAP